MPARGTARGLWGQNPSSFNVFSLPWAWMVDARQPGTLLFASLQSPPTAWTSGGETVDDLGGGLYGLRLTAGGTSQRIAIGTVSNAQANHSVRLGVRLVPGTLPWGQISNSASGMNLWVNMATGAMGASSTGISNLSIEASALGGWDISFDFTYVSGNLGIAATDAEGGINGTGLIGDTVISFTQPSYYQARVQQWPDPIAGNDPAQATPALQPAWLPDAFNGRPTIRGDGIDDFLLSAMPVTAQPFEIFSVARLGAGAVFPAFLMGTRTTTHSLGWANQVKLRIFYGVPSGEVTLANMTGRTLWYDYQVDGAATVVASPDGQGGAPTGASNNTGFTLFARNGAAVANGFCPGDISWAGILPRLLTANERSLLIAWAQQQWGPLA